MIFFLFTEYLQLDILQGSFLGCNFHETREKWNYFLSQTKLNLSVTKISVVS